MMNTKHLRMKVKYLMMNVKYLRIIIPSVGFYPFTGCSSAEPVSVYPNKNKNTKKIHDTVHFTLPISPGNFSTGAFKLAISH